MLKKVLMLPELHSDACRAAVSRLWGRSSC
jgi:hypothetical protein